MLPFATSRTHLLKSVCYHIPHPPALVLKQASERLKKHAVAALLLLGYCLGDRDQHLDCEQADTILVVAGKMLEQRDHILDHNCRGHALDEFCQVVRGLSPDHWGFIVNKLRVMLSKLFLVLRAGVLIGCVVKTGGWNLRCKPVCFREAECEGDKVLFDLLLAELLANLVEGLDGLV